MWTLNNQTFLVVARNPEQKLWFGDVEQTTTESDQVVRIFGSGELVLGPGWWDCVAVIDGPYSGPYFDGSNPPPGLLAQWAGIANGSQSIAGIDETTFYISQWQGTPKNSTSSLTTYGQPDRVNLHPRPQANNIAWSTYSSPRGQSEDISAPNIESLRGVKSLFSAPSGRIEISMGSAGTPIPNIVPGKTYTLSASVSADCGDDSIVAIILGWYNGKTIVSSTSSILNNIPDDPETPVRKSVTATAPQGADGAYALLRMTNVDSGYILWGGLALLEEGVTARPYFDGDQIPPKPILPHPGEPISGIRVIVDGEFRLARVKVYKDGAFI